MTRDPLGQGAPPPRRRLADHGRVGAFLAWWREWGSLITGVWLIAISAVLLVVAFAFYGSQSANARSSQLACERSREFGPALANAYERYRILNPRQLQAYRQTIPSRCP